MDPDATLVALQALVGRAKAHQRLSQDDVERGAELFEALDTWLRNGGFLPTEWHLSTCMSRDCRAAEVDGQ